MGVADAGPRMVEVCTCYTGSTPMFRGVGLPATSSIWQVNHFPDQPRITWLGDSWVDTGGTTNSDAAKLLATDIVGERLGCRQVLSILQGGSGILNDALGVDTYYQRAIRGSPLGDATGDLAISRIGKQDLIVIPGSINDRVENNAAFTDTGGDGRSNADRGGDGDPARRADRRHGPQQTRAVVTPQGRFEALQAGFLAAAGRHPRCILVDNSTAGDQLLFGSASTGNISLLFDAGDTAHLNDAGNAN